MSIISEDKQPGTGKSVPPLPLWRNGHFLLLLSGQGISSLGTQISQVAFPLLILSLTYSPAQAGLMAALRSLPYALFCLPAGALADRWNRKYIMIVCDAGRALALGSIPLAFLLGRLSVIQLSLVALIEGTLYTFFHMAQAAALPHVVAKEQLPAATGYNDLLTSNAVLMGPALGGILYGLSVLLPFLSDAITFTISVLSLFFIRASFQNERLVAPQRLWIEVKDGLTWLWHQPLMRFLAILTCGMTTPSVGYALIVLVRAQQQHASAALIGFIFATGGVGSLVGAVIASPLQRRFGFAKLMIGSAWLWGITWLLFAFAPNPLLLAVVSGLNYSVYRVYMVTQFSYRLALTPDHLQGRVNSVFRLIAFGGQPVGLAIAGILLQTMGPLLTVCVLFIPQLILLVAMTLNKHIRQARPLEEAA